jgi:hypothetical protein
VRLWAGVLLEITIAVIMLPVALIAGAVHHATRMVRRLRGSAEHDERQGDQPGL